MAKRQEFEPADFDACGDMRALGAAGELDIGLGCRLLMTEKTDTPESGRSPRRMIRASLLTDMP